MSINTNNNTAFGQMSDQNKYQLHDPQEEKYSKPNFQAGDDPLIQQLPVELQKYVHRPEEHKDQLVFVQRTGLSSCIHTTLSTLFCCWSICRCHLVKQGEIALTQYGDKPELLGPGRHVLLSPLNEWRGARDFRDSVIKHGPLHIIRVEMGQLGYAVDMDDGKPMLLSRGQHIINSLSFVWKKFISLNDTITKLDKLEVIRIETGNIGYVYKQGNLKILKPGLHLIEPPDRFGKIISTQMQIIDLPLGLHETSDYVCLAIKASVFYRIIEPEKTLIRIKDIDQQITETAIATLAGIIRASSLSDLGSRSQPFYHNKQKNDDDDDDKKNDDDDGDAYDDQLMPAYNDNNNISNNTPPFFQHVHDEFIQQLHDHILDEWGIEIQNIRIESLKINDPVLQKNISNNAIDVSKQHNRYIMLQKQQEIMMVEANTAASKLQIETNVQTFSVRSRAQAQADAIIIKAKANKQSLELKGQGEAERARLLQSTKLGNKLSLMKIQAQSIQGLKQVNYIPMNGQNKLLLGVQNNNQLLI